MGSLLSFSGRVSRGTYFIVWLATIIPVGFLYFNVNNSLLNGTASGGAVMFQMLVIIAIGIIALSFQVRRWHDVGKSGWWTLISLVPLIGGLYALVMNLFVAGDPGPNQYGAAPGTAAASYARP